MGKSTASSSTNLLRKLNATEVLRHAWNGEAFTATDMMTATGLTRSTVIGVCDDLVEHGWLRELENQRATGGGYSKGRPARRYAFRLDAGCVVGVDAGEHTITALVTDLSGTVLAESVAPVNHWNVRPAVRRADIARTVDKALEKAGRPASGVLAAAVGIPAPVDFSGRSPGERNEFWRWMNPGLPDLFSDRGWATLVDNDANLAGLAEGWQGAGRGLHNYLTMLVGERLGTSIVTDGHLLRGRHGAAGEMRLLDLVAGVGSADGVARLLRDWAADLSKTKGIPESSPLMSGPQNIGAEDVLRAADAGDATALMMLDRLVERFSRIFGALTNVIDTEVIIVSGAVAPSADRLLRKIAAKLPDFVSTDPPRLIASVLGQRAVSLGAVRKALDYVQENALDIKPAGSAEDGDPVKLYSA